MGCAMAKIKKGLAPWGPWEGSKGHISINYPHAFFKKRRGYCYPLHCPSLMLSSPKPSDKIQPKVCELLTWMGRATAIFFGPAPWGPGEGSKGQISFNFSYKVNFKDFYTKLCVCSHTWKVCSHTWKIQKKSDRIFILSPGTCPRGGPGGA